MIANILYVSTRLKDLKAKNSINDIERGPYNHFIV